MTRVVFVGEDEGWVKCDKCKGTGICRSPFCTIKGDHRCAYCAGKGGKNVK